MNIVLTGGLGFIGSHIATLLANAESIIIIDNCSNSSPEVFDKLKLIIHDIPLFLYYRSIDSESIDDIFASHNIDAIIHCAGLKSVSESVDDPIQYYEVNIASTLNLLKMCQKYSVKHFIFSSSATVYGDSPSPLTETSEAGKGITNPYGKTKYMIEEILKDCFPVIHMSIIILRYFNPAGAHPCGLFGENPNGVPNNLMPYIMRVAKRNMKISNEIGDPYSLNRIDGIYFDRINTIPPVVVNPYNYLSIYGNDYDTMDGTAIRDYIHVMDLAAAHIKALEYCQKQSAPILEIFNIGTGYGVSVKEMVDTFAIVNNVTIPYLYKNRRAGDLAIVYSASLKAETILGWKPTHTLENIVRDSYNYAINN